MRAWILDQSPGTYRFGTIDDPVAGPGDVRIRPVASAPRLFFEQIQIIGSTMGSYPEFADVTRLVAQGLPVTVNEVFGLQDYPAALERLRDGAQLGRIVLRHPRL